MKNKINFKSRFSNKAWLSTFIASLVSLIYLILGLFDVVPSISESELTQAIGIILTFLSSVGVVIDGSTAGIFDKSEGENGK